MSDAKCPECGGAEVAQFPRGWTCEVCEHQWASADAQAGKGVRRIFLSYGRGDATKLVERLVADLEQADYETWLDTREIRAGREWEEVIKNGLRDSNAMVAVLSPHSVRTVGSLHDVDSDSVCLDEIAFARYAKPRVPIVAAMAKSCEPPLSIFRLDYVDFTRWEDDQEYGKSLARLREGITAALRGEELFRHEIDRLQPWDFDLFLRDKRENFVGREWLLDELVAWASNPAEPALVILGDPGSGKSAIVAQLVHRNPEGRILAYHCCQADVQDTLEPVQFVRSIAAMIAGRLPEYADRLADPAVRAALYRDDPVSAFDQGVLGPLATIAPPADGVRILLVDALDEALSLRPQGRRGGNGAVPGIVNLLTSRLDRFPDWLKLVATTRKEDAVLKLLRGLNTRELDAQDPRNLDDLAQYIDRRLRSPRLAQRLQAGGRTAEKVTASLQRGADGNFLYVKQALDGIERGVHDLDDLDALPPTLVGLYQEFFQRSFPDKQAYAPVRKVLDVVVAAEVPLTVRQIARATGLHHEDALPGILKTLSAYLPPRDSDDGLTRYPVYHKSLADWLTGDDQKGSLYSASRRRGHKQLADSLWADYEHGPASLSLYALAHLPKHLAAVARLEEQPERHETTRRLVALTSDARFQDVHERRVDDVVSLHRHLVLALDVAADNDSPDSVPLATESALALVALRHGKLQPERLFELAREGELDRVQRRLDLFQVDEDWQQTVLLTAAWLAAAKCPGEARKLVDRVVETLVDRPPLPLLVDRVRAALDGIAFVPPPLQAPPDEQEVRAIVAQMGGMDIEGSPSFVAEGVEIPHPDMLREYVEADEDAVFQSEREAPLLVSFAVHNPAVGDGLLRDYVELHATNSYVMYRNRSLWGILKNVLRHPDAGWALDFVSRISSGALAGGNPEFTECLPITLAALAARGDPGSFREECDRAFTDTQQLVPERGQGDSWGGHKRRLGTMAEALACVLDDAPEASRLLDLACGLSYGFAGFGAPAYLALAESMRVCDVAGIDKALEGAFGAAHNVQDPPFCARTSSRCRTLATHWWPQSPVDVQAVVERLTQDPGAPDFAPVHEIGYVYDGRATTPGSLPLPAWVRDADTLYDLALVYQRPLPDFERLNPEVDNALTVLAPGTQVRVPDPDFPPLLAGWLAAQVLADPIYGKAERARIVQVLLPVAVVNPTALDTVLGRLLLALSPGDPSVLKEFHESIVRHRPAEESSRFVPPGSES